MKFLAFVLIGQVILINASPISLLTDDHSQQSQPKVHAQAKTFSKDTPTGKVAAASASASARRFRREEPVVAPLCPKIDYKLVQEKVTLALQKAVEKLINNQTRKKRSSEAKAASSVGLGGKTSSSASALHTPDTVPAPSEPVVDTSVPKTEGSEPGHPADPVPNVALHSNDTALNGTIHPNEPEPALNGEHRIIAPIPKVGVHQADPAPAVPHRKQNKIQNVNAEADMSTGTAIATASKRSADVQNVAASGFKAIASAKNKKPSTDGTNIQKVTATGGQLAVATADSGSNDDTDKREPLPAPIPVPDKREPLPAPIPVPDNFAGADGKPGNGRIRDMNVQKVKASGNTAIAKAKNSKDSDTSIQNVEANGGQLAIASASDDSKSVPPPPLEREPGSPESVEPPKDAPAVPHSKRATDTTIQVVKASGANAISSANANSDGVSTFQDVSSMGTHLAVATAVKNKRSACDLLTFDDSMKSLINHAVADAFKGM